MKLGDYWLMGLMCPTYDVTPVADFDLVSNLPWSNLFDWVWYTGSACE